MIPNTHRLSRKVPVIIVTLNEKKFLDTFSINPQIPNFMKLHPVGADFDADRETGQTDMTKLTVDFRNFANAPRNGL
jgi:hypothetical protein